MGLETSVVDIDDLNRLWPLGTDQEKDGDNHIRNIKTALLNDLVGFTGAIIVTGVDGGAVNSYTLTPASAQLLSYAARTLVIFSPTVTNTGAATINISSLGALPIKQVSGVDVAAGDLVAGSVYLGIGTGTTMQLSAITKNYIDQIAFSTALPAQPGGTSLFQLESSNGVAFWTNLATEKATNQYALNLALRSLAYSQ